MKSLVQFRITMVLMMMTSFGIHATDSSTNKPLTMAELLTTSKARDWQSLDPENTLYLELTNGKVVIELCPAFAPKHVANVKALVRERYFDGLAILRAQDNYVVQWGDPHAEKPELARKIERARKTLPPELIARSTSSCLLQPCQTEMSTRLKSAFQVAFRSRATSATVRCGWCTRMAWSVPDATMRPIPAAARSYTS